MVKKMTSRAGAGCCRRYAACCLIATAILLGVGGLPGAMAADREQRPATGGVIPYNHYQYNYPHEIPADYVFRTGRVFSPQELRRRQPAASAEGEEGRESAGGLSEAAIRSLVQQLLRGGREDILDTYSLAVTPPVSLHNLYATSSFGRLLGERLLGELQRAGAEVVDVRKTPALLISQRHGEYGLSRDMDELPFVLDAQAVLVGTYTATAERVQVELRILRNQDGRVLTSARHDFDMSGEVAALLADEGVPPRPAATVRVQGHE